MKEVSGEVNLKRVTDASSTSVIDRDRSGALGKAIEVLQVLENSSDLIRPWLLGFRHVFSARDLLDVCISTSEQHSNLQPMVKSVVMEWPSLLCACDFSSDDGQNLRNLLLEWVSTTGWWSQDELRRFRLKLARRPNSELISLQFPASPNTGCVSSDVQLMNIILSGCPPEEFASACTYWDSRFFLRISPAPQPQDEHILDFFNRISRGIKSCIMWANDGDSRARLTEKLIDVAIVLYDQLNFNSCCAFVSALLAPDMGRLIRTVHISQNHRRTLRQLEILFSSDQNYGCLKRVEQWAVVASKPMIPCMKWLLQMAASESDNVFQAGSYLQRLIQFQPFVVETQKPLHDVLLQKVFHWPSASDTELVDKMEKITLTIPSSYLKQLHWSGGTTVGKSLLADRGELISRHAINPQLD